MWNGPVNTHVTTDFFIRAAFGETDALHFEFAAMFEPRNLKIKPFIGEVLFLDRNLRIDCIFATTLQTLI